MALHKAHCNAVQCCRRAARHSGMCFCVSQHLQSGKKPQGNVLVLPDQIYYHVEKTAVEHLSDNDTIVDMRNQRNTVSQELKPCGLCWNQNRDSGAGQSRTIQCNPPTMTATQSREKKNRNNIVSAVEYSIAVKHTECVSCIDSVWGIFFPSYLLAG